MEGRGVRGDIGDAMIVFDEDNVSFGHPASGRREGEVQTSIMRAMEEDASGLCSSRRRMMGGWAEEAARRARRGARRWIIPSSSLHSVCTVCGA